VYKNKVAILQPNYIPWKGVFDLIDRVNTFVFYDDVDYTKQDWRTRNKVKTANGSVWLTIPVKKAPLGTKINDIKIDNSKNWKKKHYQTITQSYKKAPYFDEYSYLIEKIYNEIDSDNLSEFNINTTILLSDALGINANFVKSSDLRNEGLKGMRLINICKQLEGDYYLSGPAARDYIIEEEFDDANIKLDYIQYSYPEYPQSFGEFDHYLSVLDLIFNCGPNALEFIRNNG
jgi:hypothetical protein